MASKKGKNCPLAENETIVKQFDEIRGTKIAVAQLQGLRKECIAKLVRCGYHKIFFCIMELLLK